MRGYLAKKPNVVWMLQFKSVDDPALRGEDGPLHPVNGLHVSAPVPGAKSQPECSRKLPRDPNQHAASIVGLATTATPEAVLDLDTQGKNPAAAAPGRLGGLRGGKSAGRQFVSQEAQRNRS